MGKSERSRIGAVRAVRSHSVRDGNQRQSLGNPARVFDLGQTSVAVSLPGDFNGDGMTDIAAALAGNSNSVSAKGGLFENGQGRLKLVHTKMRRLHLFEFGDQPWLPRVLRDAGTAYLAVAYRFLPLAPVWAEKLSTVLDPNKPEQLLDLCSGAGGPVTAILKELESRGFKLRVLLTDLYPSPGPLAHSRIDWITTPVDATCVPPGLTGVRTMFSAFHHFPPGAAGSILRDALEQSRAICIFEAGSATVLAVAAMILVPFYVLALMPLARPFRWQYLVFTYLIPVIPLIIFWDGVISMLRIYSPDQLRELTRDLRRHSYSWEIGQIQVRGLPGKLPYLIGRPKL